MTQQIAGYRVLEPLGRGGMGVVYRAEQVALGREVALKVIAPEFAHDAEFRQRFEREYRTAASIDHPNVVTLYEAGEADGVMFIAMQLVRGDDLRAIVRREGGLDPVRAASIVAQVGVALDAAHSAGLVHRDVKPANVLVSADDRAYLSDFGLTKHVTSAGGLTRTGQWVGTVDYLAPELVEGRSADARSDVYSLGCVLYEALTGRVPFPRDADMAKLYAHVQADPPPPSDVRPELPRALDDVVVRALAKNPEERPQSAGDLGRLTLAAAKGTSTPPAQGSVAAGDAAPSGWSPPPEPRHPQPRRRQAPAPTLPRQKRRAGGVAVAIVAAAVILTLGGVAAALIATGTLGGKKDKRTPVAAAAETVTAPAPPTTTVAAKTSSGIEYASYETPSYAAELPAGWHVEKNYESQGAFYETRLSHRGLTVLIDTTPHSDGDPRDSAIQQEDTGNSSYRRLRWRYFDLNGVQAFDWAFAKDGERRDDILFYAGGDGYGVLATGPPSRYGEVLSIARHVAGSLEPR